MRNVNASATYIQKVVRATQIRLVMDRTGRDMARAYQIEMTALVKQKNDLTETLYVAKTGALAGKLRANLARHRDICIDMRRMPLLALGATQVAQIDKARRMAMKGSVQPMRISECEPMVFALAKMEPKLPARYGAQRSRVLDMVVEAKKEFAKTLPKANETNRRPHAGAKRGRAAIIARRLAKKPKLVESRGPAMDEDQFNSWALQQFKPKRF